MTKIDSWKPKHQAYRLAQTRLNLRIWVSTDQAKAIPLVTTESQLSHMHLKLSIEKEKTHMPMDGLGFRMIVQTIHLTKELPPVDLTDRWPKKNHGNTLCILVDTVTQTQLISDCVTSPQDGSQRFHLRSLHWSELESVSLAFSFGKTKGSRDPRRREGRTTKCPDSVTLNYLMNKYSLFQFQQRVNNG